MHKTMTIRLLLALVISLVVGASSVALAQGSGGQGPRPGSDEDVSDDSTSGSEQSSAPDLGQSDDGQGDDGQGDDGQSEDGQDDDGQDDEGQDGDDRPGDRGPVSGARVFGNDRLSTAVAISQYEFRGGAAEVYLARADNFADAVAAGALKRGPVLLVPDCGTLPAIVAEEIGRLHPRRVVALGGPAAICDDMLSQAVTAAEAGRTQGGQGDSDDGAIGDDAPRTEETRTLDLAVGGQAAIPLDGVGTVTIERTESGVRLISATGVDDTWQVSTETEETDEVHVRFRSGDSRADLRAEVEDGQVRVRIRSSES